MDARGWRSAPRTIAASKAKNATAATTVRAEGAKALKLGVYRGEEHEPGCGGDAEPTERARAFSLGEAVRLHRSESGEYRDGHSQHPAPHIEQPNNSRDSDDRNGPPPPELVPRAHVVSTRPNRRSPPLVVQNRLEEALAIEVGPQDVGYVELRICQLPEHEVA